MGGFLPQPSTPIGERIPPGLPKSPSRPPPTSDTISVGTLSGNGLPRRPSATTIATSSSQVGLPVDACCLSVAFIAALESAHKDYALWYS